LEIQEIKVQNLSTHKTGWEEIKIMPIGDVQLGADGFDRERFKKQIDWGLKNDVYFIGMGDYVDVASPSNRAKLRSSGLYDSVMSALEEKAAETVEEFLSMVKGTKGRWLGMLEGHHFYEFSDGSTSDTKLAEALDTNFLGDCAFVRVRFVRPNSGSSVGLTIWAHHGEGGGIKIASPLNKIENLMPYFDADLYLIGHMHRIVAAPLDQLYMTTGKHLSHRRKMLVCTGSFLRGYLEGSTSGGRAAGTYVEQKMLGPVALGGVLIKAKPVHKSDHDYLELKAEL
jgi:hypothetical protein